MGKFNKPTFYPAYEEKLNVLSHGFGFVLSIIGFILLILRAIKLGGTLHMVSFSIFGASMILLYAASTFYHSARSERRRYLLNIVDHACIYILIAGTYTPFALVSLNGWIGWTLFSLVWILAITGIIFKLFFIGRFQTFSTIMYVVMGWIIIAVIKPLLSTLSIPGVVLLFAGGILYTIGAILFSMDKIKFNHAIFHMFVLAGTFCHFIVIYYYVLPDQ